MKKIVFCGGDKRELPVMAALCEAGYYVFAFGCPAELLPKGVQAVADIKVAFNDADVCILPQPPIGLDGRLSSLCQDPLYLTEGDFEKLKPGTPILCGVAPMNLRMQAEHCCIYELTEDDRMAVPLAAATAEGAIAEAIILDQRILVGMKALIIGFGRIGRELAWRLEGLGMEVTVAREADFIFNTAPILILDELIIGLLHRDTAIVDLAAYPGGTDFAAAKRRGIKAIHAGGMPGKYSSIYAGNVMAEFYPKFIEELAGEGEAK